MKRILPLLLILLLALSACSDSTPAVSGTAAATEPVASQTEAAPDTSTQAVELPVVSSTPPAQTEPTEPTEPTESSETTDATEPTEPFVTEPPLPTESTEASTEVP